LSSNNLGVIQLIPLERASGMNHADCLRARAFIMRLISKTVVNFLLLVLLASSSGCLTSFYAVHKAGGFTNDRIDVSQIKKGDEIINFGSGAPSGIGYVIQYPKEKDNSNLKMPDTKPYYEFYVSRPHPAYYALLPLTVPLDIVTFPIQVVGVGVWVCAIGPVAP
jgi:hypothetical protein